MGALTIGPVGGILWAKAVGCVKGSVMHAWHHDGPNGRPECGSGRNTIHQPVPKPRRDTPILRRACPRCMKAVYGLQKADYLPETVLSLPSLMAADSIAA